MRLYRPPGCGATCPSSSRISSIEAIDSLFIPVRSIRLSTLAGSKASASNRILYSLSNRGAPKLAENVLGAFDELGALPDELMAAAGEGIVDGTGDGKDVAAGHAGQPRRDQGAGFIRCFDDQRAVTEAGNDAIA